MDRLRSIEELAKEVNQWCDRHGVVPANGQAADQTSERNVRYYRTLGLLDAPQQGGGHGYGDKHRQQLIAIRILQAQGLPLNRIRNLLYGRSLEELRRIEKEGLSELQKSSSATFRPTLSESWTVTPLNDEFLLVSRRGRGMSPELRESLLALLCGETNDLKPRNTPKNYDESTC